MNAACPAPGLRQQGMVTVLAVLFLITAVIFALSKMLGITGTSSIDSQKQMDSVGALFAAESGLERGLHALNTAGALSDSTCTGISTLSGAVGSKGNVTLTGISSPVDVGGNSIACGGSTGVFCDGCKIRSVGTFGVASREITRNVSLKTVFGTAGTGTTVKMTVRNSYTYPAIVVFNLATRRAGNETDSVCTAIGASSNCVMDWNIQSQNGGGTQSVGGMGVTAQIANSLDYTTIQQTLSSSRSYAEVGALFPGNNPGPSIVSTSGGAPLSYWDDLNSSGKTVGRAHNTGETNDGAACAPTDPVSASCPAPTAVPSPIPNQGTIQASRSWCYGADMLVFGFSGRSSTLSNQPLTSVTFDTADLTTRQNISLTRLAHFPGATDITAPGDVYADIWYKYNPYYLSDSTASSGEVTGAIGAKATGTIGANIKQASISSGSTSLTVTSYDAGTLQDNDILVTSGCSSSFPAGTHVVSHVGAAGLTTYTLSSAYPGPSACNNKSFTFKGNVLTVTAITSDSGALEVGDAISGTGVTLGTSISSYGTGTGTTTGTYNISGAAQGPIPLTGSPITITSASTKLTVSSVTHGTLYVNDVISGQDASGNSIAAGTTINSFGSGSGGSGTYNLSGTAHHVDPGTTVKTTTITLNPTTGVLPSVAIAALAPIVAVRTTSATGRLAKQTTIVPGSVVDTSVRQFKISQPPSLSLNGSAQICGGACAFFDHTTSSSTTQFTVSTVADTSQWSAGFLCLVGADITPIPVFSNTITANVWHEEVK